MNLKSLKILSIIFLALFYTSVTSCKQDKKNNSEDILNENSTTSSDSLFFKLSLAQWSLHKPIYDGELDPMDFAEKASEMGFGGIEYVTGFYAEEIKNAQDPDAKMKQILDTLKTRSERHNVENLLLMVDGEGDLAVNDSVIRNQAVENHKKWVNAAQFLGCHSIRVNLFGSDDPEEWKNNSIDALTKLSTYAEEKGVNVLVENHGYLSSDIDLLVEVMQGVNMENCGTLPDFGNFCLKREGGERWSAKCVEEFPKYEGIKKMMPYAKAVSAKSYTFDENGNENVIDYKKMLQIVKNAGYNGYIGVEFEGEDISYSKGITATKDLLIKAGSEL
ncbi:sugar phosphate isomerase/epimerase family protein [Gramella sp. MAR_2010_147]|uniref:sugar phosphate isomerase/epimerase family protein n=1 Tax=Gramella sp. MAR_2010_147 TaxID=1250205 RepID=UPI0008796801|nr:sugar phosphate isomerase/epimerase family protein [Gramella sp. MAR_2010_147]SDR88127.1 Sugar phosphate isomerase/epimerase [Gramella sp. MAR_2010_147]